MFSPGCWRTRRQKKAPTLTAGRPKLDRGAECFNVNAGRAKNRPAGLLDPGPRKKGTVALGKLTPEGQGQRSKGNEKELYSGLVDCAKLGKSHHRRIPGFSSGSCRPLALLLSKVVTCPVQNEQEGLADVTVYVFEKTAPGREGACAAAARTGGRICPRRRGEGHGQRAAAGWAVSDQPRVKGRAASEKAPPAGSDQRLRCDSLFRLLASNIERRADIQVADVCVNRHTDCYLTAWHLAGVAFSILQKKPLVCLVFRT